MVDVAKLSAGYRFDCWRNARVVAGLGAVGDVAFSPSTLEGVYGDRPASGLVFAHMELH